MSGITKWFVNNLDTTERNLTRDLISVAVADGEFVGEEHEIIIEICLEEGMTLTEDEVNEFCLQLPRYKRPRKIIFAPVLRNATGKIEKPKLRKLYGQEHLVDFENQD